MMSDWIEPWQIVMVNFIVIVGIFFHSMGKRIEKLEDIILKKGIKKNEDRK